MNRFDSIYKWEPEYSAQDIKYNLKAIDVTHCNQYIVNLDDTSIFLCGLDVSTSAAQFTFLVSVRSANPLWLDHSVQGKCLEWIVLLKVLSRHLELKTQQFRTRSLLVSGLIVVKAIHIPPSSTTLNWRMSETSDQLQTKEYPAVIRVRWDKPPCWQVVGPRCHRARAPLWFLGPTHFDRVVG